MKYIYIKKDADSIVKHVLELIDIHNDKYHQCLTPITGKSSTIHTCKRIRNLRDYIEVELKDSPEPMVRIIAPDNQPYSPVVYTCVLGNSTTLFNLIFY